MSAGLERLWYQRPGEERLAQRLLLSPLEAASWFFAAGVGARNALYQSGALKVRQVSGARVVSVGNLNVGGAGKTPAVIHLANLALSRGRKVAVLSRGYGRVSSHQELYPGEGPLPDAARMGDEPWLIARRCPGAAVLVGPDRALLAERAHRELGAELILLDDGMQHRRLGRDLEVVAVDEAAGFGNGRLLPRGPLREPLSSLSRAGLIWLKVADLPGPTLPAFTAPVVRVRAHAGALLDPAGEEHPIDALRGRPVLALAALARPGGFLTTLAKLGMELAGSRLFADHHRFTAAELQSLIAQARQSGALLVTTQKDAARLPAGFPAWVVRLDTEVLSGQEHLAAGLGL